jgi:hypothetical protein
VLTLLLAQLQTNLNAQADQEEHGQARDPSSQHDHLVGLPIRLCGELLDCCVQQVDRVDAVGFAVRMFMRLPSPAAQSNERAFSALSGLVSLSVFW